PVEMAIPDLAREGAETPGALVARGHHVGVAGERDMRRRVADAGVEIVDIGGAGLAERDAMNVEAGVFQQRLEHAQRAGIGGRDGGTADQVAGNGESVTHAPAYHVRA